MKMSSIYLSITTNYGRKSIGFGRKGRNYAEDCL